MLKQDKPVRGGCFRTGSCKEGKRSSEESGSRMRRTIFTLCFGVCAVSALGEVFQMDSRGDAFVEVNQVGDEYKVICTFSPQTKFDSAINAKFNDAKGDSLCKKGIARYLNVGTNDQFSISGLYSAAPVKSDGSKLRYTFAAPVAGCQVETGVAKPKTLPQSVVTDAIPQAQVEKPMPPAVAPNGMPATEKTRKVVQSVSYMSVVKYKEVNGRTSLVSRREYRASDFVSRHEFDELCANEFARVRALGEANLRRVGIFESKRED